METVVKGRNPASVFRWFEAISTIPRPSYKEEKIADFLVRFAEERDLWHYRDAQNNVLIKRPATKGLERIPPVLFQGHTDMVCEKNADVEHDFERDPLKLRVDGNFLRATGTTLGADDGIAVAMMLALLDGEIPEHPALECLFTTAEEVGLDGAQSFDYSKINARRMINLDSEELGVVTAGCAGGLRSDLTLTYQTEPFAGEALRLSVGGLMGGHSGENINSGRANADKVMGRLLAALAERTDVRLISLSGGSKDNAIPRECEALLAVPDFEAADRCLSAVAAEIAAELSEDDRGFTVKTEQVSAGSEMLSKEDTRRAIAILVCVANGVFEMCKGVEGLVEFSRNLGIIRHEAGKLEFIFFARSPREGQLDSAKRELDLLAQMSGCTVKHFGRHPGWDFAKRSGLRDTYLEAYRKVTGREAIVNVIHAGLECGVIYAKVPDMDMISIGPTMHDIHSPAEALDMDSVETFWAVLKQWIANAIDA